MMRVDLEQGAVVARLLRPAHEQTAEPVEPGMGALDGPAAGAETSITLERLLLFAAGADVAGEAEFGDELVHLWVVVPPCPDRGRAGTPR
jgi:hypothetical protein